MHVGLDEWIRYVVPPPDWRDWLGGMAFLNFLGLLAYRYTRELFTRKPQNAGRLDWIWNVKRAAFHVCASIVPSNKLCTSDLGLRMPGWDIWLHPSIRVERECSIRWDGLDLYDLGKFSHSARYWSCSWS